MKCPFWYFNHEQPVQQGAIAMTRAYSEFWQGASLDRNKLAQALPSLPETADELLAVAARVGASRSDFHLQKDASETTVKRAPLGAAKRGVGLENVEC